MMKKLLALLMSMIMLFALCSCSDGGDKKGSSDSADALEGDWEATLNFEALTALMGDDEDLAAFAVLDGLEIGECVLDVTFKDGKMTLYAAGILDWYEDILENMLAWIAEGDNVYQLMVDDTMTADEAKEYFDNMGYDRDALVDMMTADMDVDAMLEELEDELEDEVSCYELDGNKLYFWDEDEENDEENYFQIDLDDDSFTVTTVVNDGTVNGLEDGDFVFEKK